MMYRIIRFIPAALFFSGKHLFGAFFFSFCIITFPLFVMFAIYEEKNWQDCFCRLKEFYTDMFEDFIIIGE